VKEWREKKFDFGYFYLIWKDESFSYIPKRIRSKSSRRKKKGKGATGHRRKKK